MKIHSQRDHIAPQYHAASLSRSNKGSVVGVPKTTLRLSE